MRVLRFIFSVLTLVLAINAGGQTRIIPRDRIESLANPRLSPDSSSLDFEVRHIVAERMNEDDPPSNFTFRFRNISDRTISLERITTTCSCVSAICNRSEVGPDETAEIIVRYNPKGHPGKFERKIFVYTGKGDAPAAVLKLSVDVDRGADKSSVYPILMGRIRLRRASVMFPAGRLAVERIPFVNVSNKEIALRCNEMLLPECLDFRTEPEAVGPGQEGEMIITFNPTKGQVKENMMIVLDGLGLSPSRSSIKIEIK